MPSFPNNRDSIRQATSEQRVTIVKKLPRDILQGISHTSLLPLRNIAPTSGARLLLKLENENPAGMKDRMALAMVEAAEADGHLTAGGSVVLRHSLLLIPIHP